MKLSQDHIDLIRHHIVKSEVSTETLKDDLLDHICCVIEKKMEKGISFENALPEALYEVAPNGLDDVQRKTFYLLKSPKIILMKKVIYSIGLVSACALSLGWLFNILQWTGGPELSNYGSLVFLLLFVPLLMASHYKVTAQKPLTEKIRVWTGVVSSLIVGTSLVFKLMHLQGGGWLLIAGALLFSFGFLPFLFLTMYKKAIA